MARGRGRRRGPRRRKRGSGAIAASNETGLTAASEDEGEISPTETDETETKPENDEMEDGEDKQTSESGIAEFIEKCSESVPPATLDNKKDDTLENNAAGVLPEYAKNKAVANATMEDNLSDGEIADEEDIVANPNDKKETSLQSSNTENYSKDKIETPAINKPKAEMSEVESATGASVCVQEKRELSKGEVEDIRKNLKEEQEETAEGNAEKANTEQKQESAMQNLFAQSFISWHAPQSLDENEFLSSAPVPPKINTGLNNISKPTNTTGKKEQGTVKKPPGPPPGPPPPNALRADKFQSSAQTPSPTTEVKAVSQEDSLMLISKQSGKKYPAYLKCPNCEDLLEEPVVLPCFHTVCRRRCVPKISDDCFHVMCPVCKTSKYVRTGIGSLQEAVTFSNKVLQLREEHNLPPLSQVTGPTEILCPMCTNIFSLPIKLPCRHTICRVPCLLKNMKNGNIYCPVCAKVNFIGDVQKVKMDYRVVDRIRNEKGQNFIIETSDKAKHIEHELMKNHSQIVKPLMRDEDLQAIRPDKSVDSGNIRSLLEIQLGVLPREKALNTSDAMEDPANSGDMSGDGTLMEGPNNESPGGANKNKKKKKQQALKTPPGEGDAFFLSWRPPETMEDKEFEVKPVPEGMLNPQNDKNRRNRNHSKPFQEGIEPPERPFHFAGREHEHPEFGGLAPPGTMPGNFPPPDRFPPGMNPHARGFGPPGDPMYGEFDRDDGRRPPYYPDGPPGYRDMGPLEGNPGIRDPMRPEDMSMRPPGIPRPEPNFRHEMGPDGPPGSFNPRMPNPGHPNYPPATSQAGPRPFMPPPFHGPPGMPQRMGPPQGHPGMPPGPPGMSSGPPGMPPGPPGIPSMPPGMPPGAPGMPPGPPGMHPPGMHPPGMHPPGMHPPGGPRMLPPVSGAERMPPPMGGFPPGMPPPRMGFGPPPGWVRPPPQQMQPAVSTEPPTLDPTKIPKTKEEFDQYWQDFAQKTTNYYSTMCTGQPQEMIKQIQDMCQGYLQKCWAWYSAYYNLNTIVKPKSEGFKLSNLVPKTDASSAAAATESTTTITTVSDTADKLTQQLSKKIKAKDGIVIGGSSADSTTKTTEEKVNSKDMEELKIMLLKKQLELKMKNAKDKSQLKQLKEKVKQEEAPSSDEEESKKKKEEEQERRKKEIEDLKKANEEKQKRREEEIRKMERERAKKRDKDRLTEQFMRERRSRRSRSPMGYRSRPKKRGSSRSPVRKKRRPVSSSSSSSSSSRSSSREKESAAKYIKISNIPDEIKAAELKEFVEAFGKVLNCKIGRMQGQIMAIVQMESMGDAMSCIREMQGLKFKEKELEVKYMGDKPVLKEVEVSVPQANPPKGAAPPPPTRESRPGPPPPGDRREPPPPPPDRYRGPPDPYYHDPYYRGPPPPPPYDYRGPPGPGYSGGPHAKEPEIRRIWIGNLPWGTNEHEVMSFVAHYATPEYCQIGTNEDPQMRGLYAIVALHSYVDVLKCINSLHGIRYNGRSLEVKKY